jgi:dimethylhistidine N-methyltransferase
MLKIPVDTNFTFYDFEPTMESLEDDVLAGLSADPKFLSPKFFYDKRGSQLFDQICELPEYYPTRTEIGLLEDHGHEMAELIGKGHLLFELGSGSSKKIRTLLDAIRPRFYVPMDISHDHLRNSAAGIAERFPWLEVHAACVDYSKPWELPFDPGPVKRTAFFPGSSIGNFSPKDAIILLARVMKMLGKGGGLLIGVDLKKDPAILNAAYNDAAGVTAAFNMNALDNINRNLDGSFDLDAFSHHAYYNEEMGRIEMHLVSARRQSARVGEHLFQFEEGETIHTENSYKFDIEEFHERAGEAGFGPVKVWIDANRLFSIHYLEVI